MTMPTGMEMLGSPSATVMKDVGIGDRVDRERDAVAVSDACTPHPCVMPNMAGARGYEDTAGSTCSAFFGHPSLPQTLRTVRRRSVAASWVFRSVGCSGLPLSAVPSGDGRLASCFHQLSPRGAVWSVPRGGGLCWPCTLRRYHRTEPTRPQGASPGVGWRHHRVRRRKFVLWFVCQLWV